MAFYGFLRVSEYTSLQWCDVGHSVDHISITLHKSETDPFHCGCSVKLLRTNSSTCPCHAFEHYSKLRSGVYPNTSIHQAGRFRPLSCATVTKTVIQLLCQAGINDSQYASHSFHIGAATTPAAAGLPQRLIKNLRRWSSNAYTYALHTPATILDFSNLQVVIVYKCFKSTVRGTGHSSKLTLFKLHLCAVKYVCSAIVIASFCYIINFNFTCSDLG